MKTEEFKKLIDSIDEASFKYDFEYSKAFEALYEDSKDVLTKQQKEVLTWEILLFRLMTINHAEQPDRPRFAPMIEYTDGSIFPDPDGFSDDAINYFQKRIKETSHPILKARYVDIVWEKGGKKDRHKTGQELVKAYLEAFRHYSHDYEIERIDNLHRALEVALSLERKKHGELTEQVLFEVRKYVELLYENGNYRWLMDAIEILIRNAGRIVEPELKKYVDYVDEGIEHYTSVDSNFTLRESLLKLKLEISSLLDQISYTPQDLAEDTAKSLVEEADRRTDSLFIQQHLYSQAAGIYQKAGMQDKAEQMVLKVREIGKSDDYEKQFQSFSHEVKIPQKEIDQLKKVLKSGDELPLVMGLSKNFVPSWDDAIKLSEELSETSVTQKLFSKTIIGSEGYPIAAPSSDEEYVMEQFHLQASLMHSLLKPMLREKIESKEVKFSNFTNLIKKIRKIDEDTYQTVRYGLRLFFRKDFHAANLVLTTQFEDLLRKLMPSFGLNPTRQISNTDPPIFEEKTLGRIIREYEKILEHDFYQRLKYVLIDKKQHNLRNRNAHGFVKASEDNELYCTIILQLYCTLLSQLHLKKIKK